MVDPATGQTGRLCNRYWRAIFCQRVYRKFCSCNGHQDQLEGSGLDEVGRVVETTEDDGPQPGEIIVRIDSRYFRPTEVESLWGDASKAKKQLGWEPKTTFKELVKEMVEEDLAIASRDAIVAREGFKTFKHHE